MSIPKSRKERGTISPNKKPNCQKCVKKHYGNSLVWRDNCFGCGKSVHKVRDCPNVKFKGKGKGKNQASGSNVDPPKKNNFYALRTKGETKSYADVVISMFQVYYIDVYALLHTGATISFLTNFISSKFDISRYSK